MKPEAKKSWFELVKKYVVDLEIRPEDLYAMDKTGCPPSDQGTRRVVSRRGTKTQHKQGSANRENVTSIVTICANGTALQLTVIFKGKKFQSRWNGNNVFNTS